MKGMKAPTDPLAEKYYESSKEYYPLASSTWELLP